MDVHTVGPYPVLDGQGHCSEALGLHTWVEAVSHSSSHVKVIEWG